MRDFFAGTGSWILWTRAMTVALRAFAAFFARSSRCMKNSPIIVTHQSGTREDLNSDDPLSSMNVMSDEMRCDFLCGQVKVREEMYACGDGVTGLHIV